MPQKGKPLPEYADVMPLAEWLEAVKLGHFNEYDGSGNWAKDGLFMTDDHYDNVFGNPPEGCTHVAWFNK